MFKGQFGGPAPRLGKVTCRSLMPQQNTGGNRNTNNKKQQATKHAQSVFFFVFFSSSSFLLIFLLLFSNEQTSGKDLVQGVIFSRTSFLFCAVPPGRGVALDEGKCRSFCAQAAEWLGPDWFLFGVTRNWIWWFREAFSGAATVAVLLEPNSEVPAARGKSSELLGKPIFGQFRVLV